MCHRVARGWVTARQRCGRRGRRRWKFRGGREGTPRERRAASRDTAETCAGKRASGQSRAERVRAQGQLKKLRRGCRDGCRRPRPVTCGTQFAREGAQRESDRRPLSSLVDQPLAQTGCLCVTPNRRFCGNSHLIRRGASFGEEFDFSPKGCASAALFFAKSGLPAHCTSRRLVGLVALVWTR